MAKYAILIHDDQSTYANASPEAWSAVVDAHGKFREQVFELGGSLAGGEALAPAITTITGGTTVMHGPSAETRQPLNGYYVIEARDLDHAVDTALAAMGGVGSNQAWVHLTALGHAARAIRCSRECVPSECASRVHDRYGSRSHVVSASCQTRHPSGWSFTGLTRKVQRSLRAAWASARAQDAPAAEPAPAPRNQDGADAARSSLNHRIDVARSAVLP
jgi:hypothetical protein